MPASTTKGFLGGTGIEGRGLALRFAAAGIPVVIGSRSLERAREVARGLNQELQQEVVRGAENRDMIAACQMILLTVPFEQAPAVLDTYRVAFRPGSVLVDVTVPVQFAASQPQLLDLPEGSASQLLRKRLPEGVELVAAFKTIPAHLLADLKTSLGCDVFVCGDSSRAKAQVMELIRLLPDVRPVDAGGLEAAATLERMSFLAIGINRRYKVKSARFRVIGL